MTPEARATPTAFVPAGNKLEAASRISAVTRSGPESLGPGSKERKSTLVKLAHGLHLLVDENLTKPEYAAALARQLGVGWTTECWSAGQTITLTGLNRLLEGAEWYARQVAFDWNAQVFSLARLDPQQRFRPAASKLEAVQRLAGLTGSPPESLGPGSKERKSALLNLAEGLRIPVEPKLTKPQLGGAIARALGVPWDPLCWSTASTVTLNGLNRLLFAAERALGNWGDAWGDRPQIEAAMMLEVLAVAARGPWDGRACIEQMREAESTNWAQDEWVGFYFEFIGLPALINVFGGGPIRVGNTVFDYRGRRTWDLKAHTPARRSSLAPLNDGTAIDTAVGSGGLGFVVLSGQAAYDAAFRDWQRRYREVRGRRARPRSQPPRFTRRSKATFHPCELDAFWFADSSALTRALSDGLIRTMQQGRQVTGRVRRHKYQLAVSTAKETWLCVGHRDLQTPIQA